MLGFGYVAEFPTAVLWDIGNVPPPPSQSTPVNSIWRSLNGTGYCASITLKIVTADSGTAAGVILQVDSFDVMYDTGGLL